MVKFPPFYDFGPQRRSFGPKRGPWGDPRKSSGKHKVLGAFLEAKGRKNGFGSQNNQHFMKFHVFRQKDEFHIKVWNSAKSWKTFQTLIIFALKTCYFNKTAKLWGPKAPKTPKSGKNHPISWNFKIWVEFPDFWAISPLFAKSAIFVKNDLQNH